MFQRKFIALQKLNRHKVLLVVAVISFPVLVALWRKSLHTIFFAITADDFHRTLYSWQVTQGNLVPSDLWPPFQFWVEALVLKIYPHILTVPWLVNLAASTATIICLVWLAKALDIQQIGRIFVVLLVADLPWFVWLSVSGLAEPLFCLFVSMAYAGLVQWRKSGDDWALWVSSLGLLVAGMLRFDGWGHTVAFSIMLGVWWLRVPRPRPLKWLAAASLPWTFPVAWLISQQVKHGSPFYFSNVTRNFAAKLGMKVSLSSGLLWQLKDLLTIGGISILIALLGVWFLRRQPGFLPCAFMWLSSLSLLVWSTINGVITMANPTRLVMIHALLLMPCAAVVILKLIEKNRISAIVTCLAVVAMVVARLPGLSNYPNGMPADTALVGQNIHQLRLENRLRPSDRIMIEVIFWDYIELHVLTDDPAAVLYDRRPVLLITPDGQQTVNNAGNPSLFELPLDRLQAELSRLHIRLVIAYSDLAVSKLSQIADETWSSGQFHVYLVP